MTAETVTLGIDLGTSAVKCVAVSACGEIAATGDAAFPTVSDQPNQAEQNPADWLAALREAIAQIRAQVDLEITAVGLTGQLPTLVCLDGQGLACAVTTWKDSRADAWAGAHLDDVSRQRIYERTGMPIDGRYLAPMFRYHRLDEAYQVSSILSAKDYLYFALTGSRVTDPSTAAGYGVFNIRRKAWDDALCALWPVDPKLLPSIRPAGSTGVMGKSAEKLGLPGSATVTVGCADSVASAYAMAGREEGVACIVAGSSTIIMDIVREILPDSERRYLLTPFAIDGLFGREMDLLATGTGYRWLSDLFNVTDGTLDSLAAQSEPGARGLTFSPYLAGGEQGALWDRNLSGVLHGLRLQHSASDIARAHLEGVHFETRRCIDILAETGDISRVMVAGHLAAHRSTLQMLADILGRPVVPYRHVSPAAIGAAFLAAPHLLQAQRHHSEAPIMPSEASRSYERHYKDYCRLFPTIAGAGGMS